MESLTLRGGGGGGVLFPPPPSPRSATESWMWWVDFVCLFFPWYSAIETPSAPTKAAAPVAATRQDVYAGKWEPKITNSRNYQISFVHSVFINLAALLLHELFLQCYDEDLSECFTEKVLVLASFRKYNERSSSSCLNFSPLQSFPLCSWVTKGNRKIVFSVCAKFLLAKLDLFPLVLSFVCWFICLCSSILLASTALKIIKTIRVWKYSWIHGRSQLND